MESKELENIVQRAFIGCLSRKKMLLSFLVLALSGIVVVFSRVMAVNAGPWTTMSFLFIPFFLCMAIVLSLGIVVIKLYESKQQSLKEAFLASIPTVITTAYLIVPLFLGYLVLWVVMGFFYFLQTIPAIGEFISVILVFAPYTLVLISLLMSLFSLVILFFITPIFAFQQNKQWKVVLLKQFKEHLFASILFFITAALPVIAFAGILVLAAVLTGGVFSTMEHPVIIGLKWFFIMLPFSAVITPFVVFFFNMSAEANRYLLVDTCK